MAYQYLPLDTSLHEFRLLRLRPAPSLKDNLQIQLFTASLIGNVPEYEALSYVWGSTARRTPISVEEQNDGADGDDDVLSSILVTANLDIALRHLRYDAADRVLWVDAVCINQGDIAERNNQVQHMRQIYERCTADLAWLGPNEPGPGSIVSEGATAADLRRARLRRWEDERFHNRLIHGLHLMCLVSKRDIHAVSQVLEQWDAKMPVADESREPVYKPMSEAEAEHWMRSQTARKQTDTAWLLDRDETDALQATFLTAPLWQRVWIVQELACAPRVVLVVGHEERRKKKEKEADAVAMKEAREAERHASESSGAPAHTSKAESWDASSKAAWIASRKRNAILHAETDELAADGSRNVLAFDWDRHMPGFLADDGYADAFHAVFLRHTVIPLVANLFAQAKVIEVQRGIMRAQRAAEAAAATTATAAPDDKKSNSLFDVLARFNAMCSSDPRDKVYGLLGMVSESKLLPSVDYAKSPATVFAEACVAIIEESGNLDIIGQNPFHGATDDAVNALAERRREGDKAGLASASTTPGSSRRAPPRLPSWVPSLDRSAYADSDHTSKILFAQRGIYAAGRSDCRHLLPLTVLDVDSDGTATKRALRLRGAIVGRIVHHEPVVQGSIKFGGVAGGSVFLESVRRLQWRCFGTYFGAATSAEGGNGHGNAFYAATGETMSQAFWRTITGDCTDSPNRRLDERQRAECTRTWEEINRLRGPEIEEEEAARADAERRKNEPGGQGAGGHALQEYEIDLYYAEVDAARKILAGAGATTDMYSPPPPCPQPYQPAHPHSRQPDQQGHLPDNQVTGQPLDASSREPASRQNSQPIDGQPLAQPSCQPQVLDHQWPQRSLRRKRRPKPWNSPAHKLLDTLPTLRMMQRMMQYWTFAVGQTDGLDPESHEPNPQTLFLMVREPALPGDVVAVLDGCKVPMVLRRDVVGQDVYYSVVCPAYVHGYMDGEAVEQVRQGLRQEEDILLV